MNDKKGVELSMNLIIIAAIALLVLVIVAVLVLRGGTSVSNQTNCAAQPGYVSCIAVTDSCPTGSSFLAAPCPTTDLPKCCVSPIK